MSCATQVPRPRPSRDVKSGFEATPLCGKQAIAEEIRQSWAETLERIIQTGERLSEGRFQRADYERFILPFSYSWGRKLIRIAKSPRILNPTNRPVLPDKANVLHQITLLTDRLFQLGVGEGVINRKCLVVDIKHFRQSFVEPGQCRRRRMTVVFDCNPDRDQSAIETLDHFVMAVQELAQTRFPAVNVRPPRRVKELLES